MEQGDDIKTLNNNWYKTYTPTTNEFIEKARKVHLDTYDYSNVDYKNSYTKIRIICKKHGEFLQTPNDHTSKKKGCPICVINHTLSKEEFIEKSTKKHGNKYDYSKVNYINTKIPVIIICKDHGEFLQRPSNHYSNSGCKKCSNKYNYLSNEFIIKAKEIHGNKYDYSKVNYINTNTKIIIICKKHGEFLQLPRNHIINRGCSKCFHKTEGKLYDTIKQIYPSLISQFKQDWCKNINHLPFDFCIPEDKIIIELDGAQHFRQVWNWKSVENQLENDKYKEKCANQNGYSMIRLLQEDVLYDSYDWVYELCEAINKIKDNDRITNICLCKNNEYENY